MPKKKKTYNILFDHDQHRFTTRERYEDDEWDRGNTASHHIVGDFKICPEDRYYDLVIDFEPKHNIPYYLLYGIYSTGDSFGHDEASSIVYFDLYTEDQLEIAKKNKKILETSGEHLVKLYPKTGKKKVSENIPWNGYFDSLCYVEIHETNLRNY